METIFPGIVSPQHLWLDTVLEEWDFQGQRERKAGRTFCAVREPASAHSASKGDIPDYGDGRVIRLVTDDWRKCVGTKEGPVGWREVRQLAFAFEEEDWLKVRAFYAERGPLGDPQGQRMLPGVRERVGWARAATGWFRELTVLVEVLQNDRAGQLWERFGEPRELTLAHRDSPIYFAGPHMLGDGPGLDYCIRWMPTLDEEKRCFTPQNEDELYDTTWQVVMQAVEHELARIHLTPIRRDCDDARHPRLHWGFAADGALHEAFLDWFLGVFALLKVTTCAAHGCGNPVLAPRRRYCSTACRNRQKQKDHRERQKKGGQRTLLIGRTAESQALERTHSLKGRTWRRNMRSRSFG